MLGVSSRLHEERVVDPADVAKMFPPAMKRAKRKAPVPRHVLLAHELGGCEAANAAAGYTPGRFACALRTKCPERVERVFSDVIIRNYEQSVKDYMNRRSVLLDMFK